MHTSRCIETTTTSSITVHYLAMRYTHSVLLGAAVHASGGVVLAVVLQLCTPSIVVGKVEAAAVGLVLLVNG